ncbi:MAG: hypothetical protein AAFP69_08635 [Planctomycetota bacterium]
MHHKGNLKVEAGTETKHITSVGGTVVICAEGDHLPACTSVGGWVKIHAKGDHLPACTSVCGSVYIHAEGNHLSACTSVGGAVVICAEGNHLLACTSVGRRVEIHAKGDHLPACTSVGGVTIESEDVARQNLATIAAWVASNPDSLEMKYWHSECGTSHCLAGHAEVLAKQQGRPIRGLSTCGVGNVMLGMKGSKLFFKTNEEVRSILQAEYSE